MYRIARTHHHCLAQGATGQLGSVYGLAILTFVFMLHAPCLFASEILETRLAMEMALTEGHVAGTVVFTEEACLIFRDLVLLDSEDKYRWEYAWSGAEQWYFSFTGKTDSLFIKRNGSVIEKDGVKWDARYYAPPSYSKDQDKVAEFRKKLYLFREFAHEFFPVSQGRTCPSGFWASQGSMTEKTIGDSMIEITFTYAHIYPQGTKLSLTLDRCNGCMPVSSTYTLVSPYYATEYVRGLELLKKGVPVDLKDMGTSAIFLRWPRYEYSDPVSVKVNTSSGVFVVPRVCCAYVNIPEGPLLWRSELDLEHVVLDRAPDKSHFQLDPKIEKVVEFRPYPPRQRSAGDEIKYYWRKWRNYWYNM